MNQEFQAKTKLIKKLIDNGYTSEKAISKIGIQEFLNLKLSNVEQQMFLDLTKAIASGNLYSFLAEGFATGNSEE